MRSKIIVLLILSLPIYAISQLPPEEELEKDPHYFRHEYAKQGDHAQEIKKGNYVVIGSVSLESDAVTITKKVKETIDSVEYGYLSIKKKWLIFLHSSNASEARALRNQLIKKEDPKTIWLLTVN